MKNGCSLPYRIRSELRSFEHRQRAGSGFAQLGCRRELAARGQTITAMYVARKLYGCSLEEAKELMDSLRENEVPR